MIFLTTFLAIVVCVFVGIVVCVFVGIIATLNHRLNEAYDRINNVVRERDHNRSILDKTTKTLSSTCDVIYRIARECHGIIGDCVDDDSAVIEQEQSLTAILTECHQVIGDDVSMLYGSLLATPLHLKGVGNWEALPWSCKSTLQAKHAAEKNARRAENERRDSRFVIEPDADIVAEFS